MPLGPVLQACALAAALGAAPLAAQANPPQGRGGSPTLQEQVDGLRKQQELLRSELAEIKALLKERPARAETPVAPMPPPTVTLNVRGEPFRGSAQARVAILEYSDFDCAFCAKYAREIYPLLDHAYVQAGKVKYFFRDMPGPEHPDALFKSRVARCAGEQDRFWEAHDHLFRDQGPIDGPALERFGKDLGVDASALQACLGSDRHLEAIQRSAGLARGLRIQGTPAFLIGLLTEDGTILRASKVFLGAESFEAFRAVLDDLLKPPATAKP